MNFKDAANIAFIKKVKRTDDGHLLVLPAVAKQQGLSRNYIVIVLDDELNGVYRWSPTNVAKLSVWKNGTKPCYVVPFELLTKVRDIDDIDPEKPLGGYLMRVIRKMRNE